MRIPPEPPFFRGVAEQQLLRAVNASPLRATKVQVLPPRPILFRQSVGSDVSQWYWEERSAIDSCFALGALPHAFGVSFRATLHSVPDPFYADVAKQHTRRREKPVGASP